MQNHVDLQRLEPLENILGRTLGAKRHFMSDSEQLDGNGNPVGIRSTGWYWVRPDCGDERWVPAKFDARVHRWYSIDFMGLGDRHMIEIGEEIVRK
jgi:hypothetical protein